MSSLLATPRGAVGTQSCVRHVYTHPCLPQPPPHPPSPSPPTQSPATSTSASWATMHPRSPCPCAPRTTPRPRASPNSTRLSRTPSSRSWRSHWRSSKARGAPVLAFNCLCQPHGWSVPALVPAATTLCQSLPCLPPPPQAPPAQARRSPRPPSSTTSPSRTRGSRRAKDALLTHLHFALVMTCPPLTPLTFAPHLRHQPVVLSISPHHPSVTPRSSWLPPPTWPWITWQRRSLPPVCAWCGCVPGPGRTRRWCRRA